MRPLLCGLALLAISASAQAQSLGNEVFTFDARGQARTTTTGVDSVAWHQVDARGTPIDSWHSGAAYAPTQTLRGFAALVATQPGDTPRDDWRIATAKTTVSFAKTVFIDPGITGLAVGTVVPLYLDLRFDGSLVTGAQAVGAATRRVVASVDVSAGLAITDLDDPICGEGCRPRELAEFGHSGRLMYDYNFGGLGRLDVQTVAGWHAFGTTSGRVEGPRINDYADGLPWRPQADFAVDTGVPRLHFDGVVGHTLRSAATLDIFAQAQGVGAAGGAIGAFQSTFDADLGTPLAGLQLLGETPGVAAPVPEPASLALWLAGLVGLLGSAGARGASRSSRHA